MQHVLLCVAAAYLVPCSVGEERAATATTGEVKAAIVSANDRVSGWYIEYEQSGRNTDRPLVAKIHRRVAARFPDELYHWSTKGTELVSWRDDPMQQRLTIAQGKALWELPAKRSFNLSAIEVDNELPGSMPKEILWPVLGWWPFEKWPAPKLDEDEPYLLIDITASDAYQVREQQEKCGGVWCHVLANAGTGALWFDMNRDGLMMAREFYHRETGVKIQRIEASEHTEVRPGIWCPQAFRNIFFKFDAPREEDRRQTRIDATFRVLDVKINENVPAHLFEIPAPKPGSIEFHTDGSFQQAVPGGYDYLDEMADWIGRNVRFKQPAARISKAEVACYVVVIVVALYIIIISCWRARRGTHPRSDDSLASSVESVP